MRCRCVSRNWRLLISDPIFVDMHLNNQRLLQLNDMVDTDLVVIVRETFLPVNFYMLENVGCTNESVKPFPVPPSHLTKCKVVNSCNGLLCLRGITMLNQLIYIWNPFTGEILDIPLSPDLMEVRIFCFGYDSTSNVYKVVVISYPGIPLLDDDTEFLVVAEVWTLGSGSWRKIEKVPFLPVNQQFSMEGSLYWKSYESYESDVVGIGSFHVRTEEFQFVSLPPSFNSVLNTGYVDIGALGGCIALVDYYASPGHAEIWIMKHLGVQESWTKQYVLLMEDFKYINLLCLLKSGEILFLYNGAKLVSYDPRNGQIREVGVSSVSHNADYLIERFVFVGTLVSPMIGGGVE
ncbi:hypothetical protein IFM89_031776 [Coptis chinensis]|uniref:F-box associated beta-propeller type 3 domain-containing protein n=1 Tax=Coptis chinensis TaxID=261450 RepID=A0A835H220_9MAGN|nr:hypothetical protein IFM89_031776 [Coptis chinensis]